MQEVGSSECKDGQLCVRDVFSFACLFVCLRLFRLFVSYYGERGALVVF